MWVIGSNHPAVIVVTKLDIGADSEKSSGQCSKAALRLISVM